MGNGGARRTVALSIGHSLHAYPNYLSYATNFGAGRPRLTGILRTRMWTGDRHRRWLALTSTRRDPENCFFLRTYNNKNSDYGIPCGGISEIQWDELQTPYTGTMIVSSSMVDGIGLRGAAMETRRVFKDLKAGREIRRQRSAGLSGNLRLESTGRRPTSATRAREVGDAGRAPGLRTGPAGSPLDPSRRRCPRQSCAALIMLLGQDDQARAGMQPGAHVNSQGSAVRTGADQVYGRLHRQERIEDLTTISEFPLSLAEIVLEIQRNAGRRFYPGARAAASAALVAVGRACRAAGRSRRGCVPDQVVRPGSGHLVAPESRRLDRPARCVSALRHPVAHPPPIVRGSPTAGDSKCCCRASMRGSG